jgi:hypothetical protein
MLPRIYAIDYDEAVRYWTHDAEEEAEAEAVINRQESEEEELRAQVQRNFSEQNQESRRRSRRDEKRSDAKIAEQASTSKSQIVVALSASTRVTSGSPSVLLG